MSQIYVYQPLSVHLFAIFLHHVTTKSVSIISIFSSLASQIG
jgi:hypothetical protein